MPDPALPEIESVLITAEQIRVRVRELGAAIEQDYAGRDLHVVGILRGATMLLADLVRAINLPLTLDFMAVESYAGTATTGAVRILKDLQESIEGRHVLLVEDVMDTGLTLSFLLESLRDRGPASVEVCALLDKPEARRQQVRARYVGFVIPDVFVVGYGLDFEQRYRNLPFVAVYRKGHGREGPGSGV